MIQQELVEKDNEVSELCAIIDNIKMEKRQLEEIILEKNSKA